MRKWRIAMYSHDTMGLGHMRRNLRIAQTLACSPSRPVVLMIAGAREASCLPMPRGVDCVTLPALHKGMDGHYQPRHLDFALKKLIALRAGAIRAALEAFEPDVLIVDKVPRGALGELNRSLEGLRRHGRTRCVLGLRDVLDDPMTVEHEWRQAQNEEAIRDYYDAVWVYGDPVVYDLVREYQLSPDLVTKVRYTGYLGHFSRRQYGDHLPPGCPAAVPQGRTIVCLVGGGQDGAPLAEAFAAADLPPNTHGIILMGPFMPLQVQQRVRRRAAQNARLSVLEFIPGPDLLLRCAERVVAMGGYNTVCEALSFERHALIVPRVKPRCEQLVRAERLRALGLLQLLHPDELTPQALTEWLARDLGPPPRFRDRIDLNGLARIPQLLGNLLAAPWDRAESQLPPQRVRYVAH